MASPRQIELFPARRRSAEDRRTLIRQKLEGLEFRQRAREERRRRQLERRKTRESGESKAAAAQVTLEEMIDRSRAQRS